MCCAGWTLSNVTCSRIWERQRRSDIISENILVEMSDRGIVVRLRGTSMRAIYAKGDNPWLTQTRIIEDKDAGMKLIEFWALAWTAANDKARELGWIV
jgi:hypothetical protein